MGSSTTLGFTSRRMRTVSGEAFDMRFISETGVAADIAALVEPMLDQLGFRLVRVAISGRDGTTVQIMAERPDGTISVEDCALVSRNLSPLMDAHDPIAGQYTLEVSSPGIDRPLMRPSDFVKWSGHVAKIQLKEAVSGRKRFRGVLDGVENGEVRMETDLGEAGLQTVGLPIALISEARLVLTEELIRETLRRAKKGNAVSDAARPSSE
jgi:ribosome maturation factor RimP